MEPGPGGRALGPPDAARGCLLALRGDAMAKIKSGEDAPNPLLIDPLKTGSRSKCDLIFQTPLFDWGA
eukprot:5779709-Pyramimonas_sp.AAC.1